MNTISACCLTCKIGRHQ